MRVPRLAIPAIAATLALAGTTASGDAIAEAFSRTLEECLAANEQSCEFYYASTPSDEVFCGLAPAILARDRAAVDELFANCLPKTLFSGRAMTPGEIAVKSEILEGIGRSPVEGYELLRFYPHLQTCGKEMTFFYVTIVLNDGKAGIELYTHSLLECSNE